MVNSLDTEERAVLGDGTASTDLFILMSFPLQEADLFVGLGEHRHRAEGAKSLGAENLSDGDDGILPCLAHMLATCRLRVLRRANVTANVVALVGRRVRFFLVIGGVVAGVRVALAGVVGGFGGHHAFKVGERILDLVHCLFQLVDGTLHGGFGVDADLDGGASDADPVIVVHDDSAAVDLRCAEPGRHLEVVHLRWQGAFDHVAHLRPRVLWDCLLVPVRVADGVGVRTAHAIVDLDTAAVVRRASLSASRVQALREEPAERLRHVVRLDLPVCAMCEAGTGRGMLCQSTPFV